MAGPIYRQIAADLRHKIESGELKEGERLPTEDKLMVAYNTSRSTVRGALKELATRSLVYTLHGKGTYVTEQVRPIVTSLTKDPKTGGSGGEGVAYASEVAAVGRTLSVTSPRVQILKATSGIARALQIPEGSEVISRYQERYVDGRPWSLQTSYYPRHLSQHASRLLDTDDIVEGTVAHMAMAGIRQTGYRDAIEVRSPDEAETAYFDLPVDGHVQIFEITRVGFEQSGAPLRLTITIYRADRNRFVLTVGDVPDEQPE
jgi:GntR family transcriptional regulator